MEIKFGKLPARVDKRTIKLASIIKKELLPDLPSSYDIDSNLGVEDNFVFGNDKYGDCVIAARAHQTLRFEKFEQGIQPAITDKEVIDEYLKESGGFDIGLYMLNSLKEWRNKGWVVGDKTYTIYAFASVNWLDHDEVRHCIHLLGGVNFGMKVYSKDIEQFNNDEIWDITPNPGNLEGGHGVYIYSYGAIDSYDKEGVTCMTWGKRQKMTWNFWDARIDEAYGIVDNRDDWLGDSPIDVALLDSYLAEITAGNEQPSTCTFSQGIVKGLNKLWKMFGAKTRFPPPIVPR